MVGLQLACVKDWKIFCGLQVFLVAIGVSVSVVCFCVVASVRTFLCVCVCVCVCVWVWEWECVVLMRIFDTFFTPHQIKVLYRLVLGWAMKPPPSPQPCNPGETLDWYAFKPYVSQYSWNCYLWPQLGVGFKEIVRLKQFGIFNRGSECIGTHRLCVCMYVVAVCEASCFVLQAIG